MINKMTTPTPEQLEELRLKCANMLGWKQETRKYYDIWVLPNGDMAPTDPPLYSTSYDAIMPEIKKLTALENDKFLEILSQISNGIHQLDCEPWQLCEAFVRLKTEGEKC